MRNRNPIGIVESAYNLRNYSSMTTFLLSRLSTISLVLVLVLAVVTGSTRSRANIRSRMRRMSMVPDTATSALSERVFEPLDVGPEIYAGSIIAVLPIIYATVLFTQRVNTQRNCEVCKGSGLVYQSSKGNPLKRPRKCLNCGGFLPFISWKYFFFTSFTDPGNGGVLLLPRKTKEPVPIVEDDESE